MDFDEARCKKDDTDALSVRLEGAPEGDSFREIGLTPASEMTWRSFPQKGVQWVASPDLDYPNEGTSQTTFAAQPGGPTFRAFDLVEGPGGVRGIITGFTILFDRELRRLATIADLEGGKDANLATLKVVKTVAEFEKEADRIWQETCRAHPAEMKRRSALLKDALRPDRPAIGLSDKELSIADKLERVILGTLAAKVNAMPLEGRDILTDLLWKRLQEAGFEFENLNGFRGAIRGRRQPVPTP